MNEKEAMVAKVKQAANDIINDYMMGILSRTEAHAFLSRLNETCSAIHELNLAPIDTSETQDYIQSLRERYTI